MSGWAYGIVKKGAKYAYQCDFIILQDTVRS